DQRMQIYAKSLTPANSEIGKFWQASYLALYQLSALIEGVSPSTALSPFGKDQLLGEALFSRAFIYFHLVNLYGDVPLVLTTDASQNRLAYRSPVERVYDQIVIDLKGAEVLLGSGYVTGAGTPTDLRIRPNRGAAQS